jgi:uncharacterized membrane protein YjgN (DUF898 family)
VWRGVRFWMSGSGWAYSWRSCLWALFTLLTLGLALPWRESALERYKMRHQHYGDLEARFDGTGWGLFKRGWWLWLLSLPIITVPLTFPAYKAVLWRWWLSGIRFGEVRIDSDLRTGALMGLYWAVIGWIVVLLIIDGIVVSTVGFATLFLSSGRVGAGTLVEFLRQYPYVVLGANLVNYLVVALCAGIVVRVYLVRGVWERVVTSAVVHDLDRADNVRAEGTLASALGEGLADGLDIAGF